MGTSISPSPFYFPSRIRFLRRHVKFKFSSKPPILIRPKTTRRRPFSISASIAHNDAPQFSWLSSSDQNAPDDVFNGWAVVQSPFRDKKMNKGATLVIIGAVASIALVGVVAYISLSNKGFPLQFRSQFNSIQRVLSPSKTEEEGIGSEPVDHNVLTENAEISEVRHEVVSDPVDENVEQESRLYKTVRDQVDRILVPIGVDSTQQEALSVLKELKIYRLLKMMLKQMNYVQGENTQDGWFVQIQNWRGVGILGSTVAAFNDVSVEDPDFEHIQSLAEAGIIPSKLSGRDAASDLYNSEGGEGVKFSPERFISRQDLISWKAKLEYGVMPGIDEEISRRNIGVLDVRDISSDAIVGLFMDLQADEKSILKRTFGQSKRFQPRKPSTKAQAAVALTSGRLAKLISSELSRIEAENALKRIAMQEIKSELLENGDIQKFWDRIMEEERSRVLKAEEAYLAAVGELEQEKINQENVLNEFLKQTAALNCQKQLLYSLKDNVSEMSERLTIERAQYIEERSDVDALLLSLQVKYEGLLDAKSILEAEVEALRILRSWVEEEARKSQARSQVLGEVERRWKWFKQS